MSLNLGLGLGLSNESGGGTPPFDKNSPYYKQVQLLVSIIPLVAQEDIFALKGGTAINLFIRDLPRLSVDIDLTYLPIDERKVALANIRTAFEQLKQNIETSRPDLRVHYQAKDAEHRLIVSAQDAQIKIELSPVLRGCVFEPETRTVTKSVEDEFGFAEIQVVSFNDLYAGKVCAALDRQHPRDLFDIKLLLNDEGLSRDLIRTFIVYLISHQRPISELIQPRHKDIKEAYDNSFVGMTQTPVPLEELEQARIELNDSLFSQLTDDDKEFLISFKAMEPKWDLLGLDDIDQLPAVKWKMLNLAKMPDDNHKDALKNLQNKLEK